MQRLLIVLLLVAVALLGGPRLLEPESSAARVERVVDGDTLVARVEGEEETVRLLGIDTPETGDCGYERAARALEELADGRRVRLVEDPSQAERDRYGRLLRYVEAGNVDLGEEVVRLGWADVYVFEEPFDRVGDYRDAAADARRAGRGLADACS